MEAKELKDQLDGIKTTLEASVEKVKSDLETNIKKIDEAVQKGNPDFIKKVIAEETKSINESLQALAQWQKDRQPIEAADRQAIDNMLSELKQISRNTVQSGKGRSFKDAFIEEISKQENIEALGDLGRGKKHTIYLKNVTSLKAVGNMTLGVNLSGDQVGSYRSEPSIKPSQKVNFRDLVPTVYTKTGLFIHYDEGAGEGSIGNQIEGNAKSQIDFDLTEVKTVQKYMSGFTRFSKQYSQDIPFFQETLPRLLLREFFRNENSYFKGRVAAAATGTWNTTAETDKVKRMIDFIGYQRDADYNVDYALVNHAAMSEYQKLTYVNGYYAGSGGVSVDSVGTIRVSGVPVIPVSWMTANKVLLIDNDFLERIEVDGLKVEFFEQDGDNVTKNLITARIECREEINPMRGAAFVFANL